jgi:hypothetical protein
MVGPLYFPEIMMYLHFLYPSISFQKYLKFPFICPSFRWQQQTELFSPWYLTLNVKASVAWVRFPSVFNNLSRWENIGGWCAYKPAMCTCLRYWITAEFLGFSSNASQVIKSGLRRVHSWLFGLWDCGFESGTGHGYMSTFYCLV